MTPNELRALADEMQSNIDEARIILRGDITVEDKAWFAMHDKAIAYLRACADVQPVAKIERVAAGAIALFTPSGEPFDISQHVGASLYTHPAPAAPHYAMLDSHRRLVERAIEDAEHPSGMSTHDGKARIDASILRRMLAIIDSLPAVPQAEPKRDWSVIDAAIREYLDNYELIGEDDSGADACYTPTERELYLIYDAINGLLADESFVAAISAPQAEPKPTPASGNDLNVYKEMADNYRNDAEPTGTPYGIIDPDYGRVYTIARKLAWEEGYAIGLHGSFTRDLDLIAVPWAERACEAEHLIRRIVDATGLKLRDGVGVKPHGRRAWTLLFPAFGDPRFVDLSVMPRIGGSDAQAEPKREDQPLRDLLAVIHCDGGHHTEAVGIEQSIKDALTTVYVLKGKLAEAEPKREPLSDEQIELPDYLRLQIASTAAAHDVLVERRRQVEVEGWTPEHDDEHDAGALALAAAAYALDAGDKCSPYSQGDGGGEAPEFWPWTHGSGRHREARWWKPSTPRRNLVKAGALILAEIERLDRMGGSDEHQ